MQTAEKLYNKVDSLTVDELKAEAVKEGGVHSRTYLMPVQYEVYKFSDRSALVIGDNGYVGCETTA